MASVQLRIAASLVVVGPGVGPRVCLDGGPRDLDMRAGALLSPTPTFPARAAVILCLDFHRGGDGARATLAASARRPMRA